MNDYLKFQGNKYKIRQVYSNRFGEVTLASSFINNKLLTEEGNYVSDEARIIDEQIFFFISNKYFGLSDSELVGKIEKLIL